MTTESKIKGGVLTIGGVEFAAQASAVRITPGHDTSGDPLELLDGTVLPATTTRGNQLQITALQDFTDPAGFQRYSWENDLDTVAFTWQPRGATSGQPSFSGQVQVKALQVGGEVNTRLSVDAEWECVGDVTWGTVA